MADVVRLGGFEFEFPVWVVVRNADYESQGLLHGIVVARNPHTGVTVFPVFTDTDWAERYARNGPGRGTIAVSDRAELLRLATAFRNVMVPYVGIDIPGDDEPDSAPVQLSPIDLFIAALRS